MQTVPAFIFVHFLIFHVALIITRNAGVASRITSLMHAISSLANVISSSGVLLGISDWTEATHPAMTRGLEFSIAYFLTDLLVMGAYMRRDERDTTMFVHHVCIIAAFTTSLSYGYYVPVLFSFLVEEGSTIFLNLRTIFPGHRAVLDVAFAALFFLLRIVAGTIIFFVGVMSIPAQAGEKRTLGLALASMGIATRVLNSLWLWLILRKVLRRRKHSRDGIQDRRPASSG